MLHPARLTAVCLVMLLAVFALQATAAGARSNEPEPVVVPFDPPIGETLRFRLTRTGTDPFKPHPNSVLLQNVTFERGEGVYLMTVETVSVTQEGRTFVSTPPDLILLSREDMFALSSAVTFELSPTGRALRVHNWDELKEIYRKLPERVVGGQVPEDMKSTIRSLLTDTISPILALSPEAAITLIAQEWPPFTGYGGGAHVLGQTTKKQETFKLLDAPVPVNYTAETRVSEGPGSGLTIHSTQRSDQVEQAVNSGPMAPSKMPPPGMPAELVKALRERDERLQNSIHLSTVTMELDERGVWTTGSWETRDEDQTGVIRSTGINLERLPAP